MGIQIFIIALFILLGIIMLSGKGSFLIAGFNTMSKAEKEKYDEVALCKFMGKMMFALAFNVLLWLLSQTFEVTVLLYVGIILFISVILFMLIYMNTGNRFMRSGMVIKGMKNNTSLKPLLATLVIIVLVGIFLFILISGTMKETEVVIQGDQIVFKGQYGVTYTLKDISDVQLKNDIPSIGMKVNGAGLGEIMKGDFKIEGLGTCRLFVHSEKGPYIYMVVGGKFTIINFKDSAKTITLYDSLKKHIVK